MTVALLASSSPAWAKNARLHLSGLRTKGAPPSRLEPAVASHLQIALRQIGVELAIDPPFDVDVNIACAFSAPPSRKGSCVIDIFQLSTGVQRRREASIPFHDREDFATTLSFLLSGSLQRDFGYSIELPAGETPPMALEAAAPLEPTPAPAPAQVPKPPGPPAPARKPSSVKAAKEPPVKAAKEPPVKVAKEPPVARARKPGGLLVEAAPTCAFGTTNDPLLFGAAVRAAYFDARGLRAGGVLSLGGNRLTRDGYDLSFFRAVVGARLGFGLLGRRLGADVTAGPALVVLRTDAGVDGARNLVAFALTIDAGLAVFLSHSLAAQARVGYQWATSDEKIASPSGSLTAFGHGSFDVGVGLSYYYYGP